MKRWMKDKKTQSLLDCSSDVKFETRRRSVLAECFRWQQKEMCGWQEVPQPRGHQPLGKRQWEEASFRRRREIIVPRRSWSIQILTLDDIRVHLIHSWLALGDSPLRLNMFVCSCCCCNVSVPTSRGTNSSRR